MRRSAAASAIIVVALTATSVAAAPPDVLGVGVCVNGIAVDPFVTNTWGLDVYVGVLVTTNGGSIVQLFLDRDDFRRACCASAGQPPTCYARSALAGAEPA